MTSPAMIAYLAKPLTTLIPIWKMESADGLVAAYAQHSRPISGRAFNSGGATSTLFTFNGVVYAPSVVEATRPTRSIGLSPNNVECSGIFDSVVTEQDILGGRWKEAAITFEYVNYLDLTMGSTGVMEGFTGKFDITGPTFKVEFRSKSSLLHQLIGELTSPIDRNSFPAGVDPATFTFSRNIVSSTDRANFVIDGTVEIDNYWQYGLVNWTTGANTGEPPMEIKSSTGNTISLQLPMRSIISPGEVVSLLAGYSGTRDDARDKFDDMIDFNGCPDLPGLKSVLTYPL